jgi:hypothetical protein
MMRQEITIDIAPDGEVTVEGHGDLGKTCTELTAQLEKALGDVTRQTLKPDYSQPVRRNQTIKATNHA